MNNMTYLVLFWVYRTDIDRLIDQILLEEPLISESRKPALKKLIESKLFVVVDIKFGRADREADGELGSEVRVLQGSSRSLTPIDQLRFQ